MRPRRASSEGDILTAYLIAYSDTDWVGVTEVHNRFCLHCKLQNSILDKQQTNILSFLRMLHSDLDEDLSLPANMYEDREPYL